MSITIRQMDLGTLNRLKRQVDEELNRRRNDLEQEEKTKNV